MFLGWGMRPFLWFPEIWPHKKVRRATAKTELQYQSDRTCIISVFERDEI